MMNSNRGTIPSQKRGPGRDTCAGGKTGGTFGAATLGFGGDDSGAAGGTPTHTFTHTKIHSYININL